MQNSTVRNIDTLQPWTMKELTALYDEHFDPKWFEGEPKELYQTAAHILQAKGKRLRPVAVLMASWLDRPASTIFSSSTCTPNPGKHSGLAPVSVPANKETPNCAIRSTI